MNAAVVVAGGEGRRFGAADGKQLALVEGLPVLGHTLLAFERCEPVDQIVLVGHPDRLAEYRERVVQGLRLDKVRAVVAGGETRRESVRAGLRAIGAGSGPNTVSVHDGARPLVTSSLIASAIAELTRIDVDGVVVGHPSYDTIKTVDADCFVVGTPDRSRLWVVQTPQVFWLERLIAAHESAERDGFEGTDDASLIEREGGRIEMLLGPRDNVKVTVPEDLAYVASVLRSRAGEE